MGCGSILLCEVNAVSGGDELCRAIGKWKKGQETYCKNYLGGRPPLIHLDLASNACVTAQWYRFWDQRKFHRIQHHIPCPIIDGDLDEKWGTKWF